MEQAMLLRSISGSKSKIACLQFTQRNTIIGDIAWKHQFEFSNIITNLEKLMFNSIHLLWIWNYVINSKTLKLNWKHNFWLWSAILKSKPNFHVSNLGNISKLIRVAMFPSWLSFLRYDSNLAVKVHRDLKVSIYQIES